jgi:hypothetical protein
MSKGDAEEFSGKGKGARAGYEGEGSYEYDLGDGFKATRMATDMWYVFNNGVDVGEDFKTLAAARKWHKKNASK